VGPRPAGPAWPELPPPSDGAKRVEEVLRERGACFFHEIERASGLGRDGVEGALAELVARGAASSDSWSGLRALVATRDERPIDGRHAGPSVRAMESAGRWSLVDAVTAPPLGARLDEVRASEEANLEVARILLRRWGVIVRRAVEREGMAPPWRDLVRALRRLEARGEIRGGRFVSGQSGEQFALPEAVGTLREVRRRPSRGETVTISAADPLNLVGLVTPGARIPAIASHRIVLCDGVPIAVRDGDGLRTLGPSHPTESAWA
jgi:ATP-dependent Lhr-like helicase